MVIETELPSIIFCLYTKNKTYDKGLYNHLICTSYSVLKVRLLMTNTVFRWTYFCLFSLSLDLEREDEEDEEEEEDREDELLLEELSELPDDPVELLDELERKAESYTI